MRGGVAARFGGDRVDAGVSWSVSRIAWGDIAARWCDAGGFEDSRVDRSVVGWGVWRGDIGDESVDRGRGDGVVFDEIDSAVGCESIAHSVGASDGGAVGVCR